MLNILFFKTAICELDLGDHGIAKMIEYGVERPARCLDWAFGYNWYHNYGTLIPQAWNLRHKDLFRMYNADTLDDSLGKVAQYCKEGMCDIGHQLKYGEFASVN